MMNLMKVAGLHFWVRVLCESAVGLNEQTICNYFCEHEKYEKQQIEFDTV